MSRLIKLLAQNKGRGFFRAEQKGDTAEIFLYDVIVPDDYWGGVSALSFINELRALTAPEIHIRINSPGGDVFAAQAMAQAIREHSSKIIAHIDGYAASAATFPVIAANEAVINKSGMFMIHRALTYAMGNVQDLRDSADLLERIDTILAADYVAKTGQTEQQIIDWMDAETYFFGQEAVDAGFVGSVAETGAQNKISWDISAYKNAPRIDPPVNHEPIQDQKPADIARPDLSHHYRRLALIEKTA
jgi:ATP-dependent Clp protease protease subunit